MRGTPGQVVEAICEAARSLAFDRREKGSLYDRAGVPDYWILNPVDRVVEVHRDPAPDATASFGWRYAAVERLGAEDTASPFALPSVRIPVSAILPYRRVRDRYAAGWPSAQVRRSSRPR